jgi:VanZ family protein
MITRVSRSRVVGLWLPVVAWAGLIFALSSLHSLDSGLGAWDEVLRSLAHATEYAVLGALLVRALDRPLPAFALGLAYAVSDELHQHFVPGRTADPRDVAIDALGVVAGIALYRRLRDPA